jgi:hypothetical protein
MFCILINGERNTPCGDCRFIKSCVVKNEKITIKEACELSDQIMKNAESERLGIAEKEASIGVQY